MMIGHSNKATEAFSQAQPKLAPLMPTPGATAAQQHWTTKQYMNCPTSCDQIPLLLCISDELIFPQRDVISGYWLVDC